MSLRIVQYIFALLVCTTSVFAFLDPKTLQEECVLFFGPDLAWLDQQGVTGPQLLKISNDKKALKKIFEKVSASTARIQKAQTIGTSRENLGKNRCPHFIPFDMNLPCRDVLPNFYISGSEVLAEGQKYLLVQAPLQANMSDFWRMMICTQSPLIVTTVTPYEGKGIAEKCFPYWNEAIPLDVDGWHITRDGQDIVLATQGTERIVQRLFRLSHSTTNQVRQVKQLHYEQWKDNSVPHLPLFQQLLRTIDSLTIPRDTPITVHCSAGMGRTGTFVTAYTLHQQLLQNKEAFLEEKKALNIPKCILYLRLQRKSLVANQKQLQFIYESAAASFEELLSTPRGEN